MELLFVFLVAFCFFIFTLRPRAPRTRAAADAKQSRRSETPAKLSIARTLSASPDTRSQALGKTPCAVRRNTSMREKSLTHTSPPLRGTLSYEDHERIKKSTPETTMTRQITPVVRRTPSYEDRRERWLSNRSCSENTLSSGALFYSNVVALKQRGSVFSYPVAPVPVPRATKGKKKKSTMSQRSPHPASVSDNDVKHCKTESNLKSRNCAARKQVDSNITRSLPERDMRFNQKMIKILSSRQINKSAKAPHVVPQPFCHCNHVDQDLGMRHEVFSAFSERTS